MSKVISHAAQIPEDMVFRDVTERFKDIENRESGTLMGAIGSSRGAVMPTLNYLPSNSAFSGSFFHLNCLANSVGV